MWWSLVELSFSAFSSIPITFDRCNPTSTIHSTDLRISRPDGNVAVDWQDYKDYIEAEEPTVDSKAADRRSNIAIVADSRKSAGAALAADTLDDIADDSTV